MIFILLWYDLSVRFHCKFCKKWFKLELKWHSHLLFTHGFFLQTCSVRFGDEGKRIDELRQSWYRLLEKIESNDLRLKSFRKSWHMIDTTNIRYMNYVEKRMITANRKHWVLLDTKEILHTTLKKEGIVV